MRVSEMTTAQFEEKAKQLICGELNKVSNTEIQTTEIHTVWYSKVLQNKKGLFMVQGCPLYFEVTGNGATDRLYVDMYSKICNNTYSSIEE